MIEIKTNLKFGKEYEDTITGIRGILTCISKWQFGCLRVGLQRKVDKEGKVPEIHWIDEPAIKNIKEIICEDPGGPRSDPKSQY